MLLRNSWAYSRDEVTAREASQPPVAVPAVIGAAIGLGASDGRCERGPATLAVHGLFETLRHYAPTLESAGTIHARGSRRGESVIPNIAGFCRQLADVTQLVVSQNRSPWVIGGDHSCAIGTWTGVTGALASSGSVGLIWLDAHMDSHTPETSRSGAVHGMPLACLLGFGPTALVRLGGFSPKLLPEDVCVVGVRSFEPAEATLLTELGVRVFDMDEVDRRGLSTVLDEAQSHVQRHTAAYGITIDIDVIDPGDAPGVGTPEPGGIGGKDLSAALRELTEQSAPVGVELAEYNPDKDVNGMTADLICELFASVSGMRGAL